MNNSDNALTHENVRWELESSWNELQIYLGSLIEEQLIRPTDAAGWTTKDHIYYPPGDL